MSDTPDYPQQSPAAAAASAAQASSLVIQQSALQNQLHMQDLLAPVLFQQLGLTPTKDSTGQITGFTQNTPNQDLSNQAGQLALGREITALKGDLPIDPQLTQTLDRQEQQLHDQLRQSLGPDYASSTPGQQAIQDFNQRKANIIASAARGDIASAGQLAIQQSTSNAATIDQQIAAALGITQAPNQGISLFSNVANGQGQIVSQDNQVRQNEFQAMNQSSSGLGSLFGTIAGVALAPYTGGASLALSGALGGGLNSLFGSTPTYGPGSTQAGYSSQYGFGGSGGGWIPGTVSP